MFQKKKRKWSRLDNAAKIFPATSGKKDARVFRASCELNDIIDPDVLQQALDITIEAFPFFCYILRNGLFWYYFESSDLKPVVKEEYRLPCSNLYIRDQKNLLFEVTYYKKRINLEVYHALTDGTGALQFIKKLVYHYILIKHKDAFNDRIPMLDYDATYAEQQDDSFLKYYTAGSKKEKKEKIPTYRAYQLRGVKTEYEHMNITEGTLSVAALVKKAREYHTTVTILLTAILFCAIQKEMSIRQQRKPVALMIPVNLRKYFPSESARNFFGWIDIGYNFHTQSAELKDVIAFVDEFFKKEITKERMTIRMNDLIKLEMNPVIRLVPLQIKVWIMQLGAKLSPSSDTAIFSNVGKITMPEEFSPYIRLFDIFTSTPKKELSMCSYNDNFVLTFASQFEKVDIEKNFFRTLTNMGIDIEITAKHYYED